MSEALGHEGAVLLLGDLAEGRLDEHEARGLELHIEGCDECRSWIETYRELASALPRARVADDHPSAELLASFAADPEALEPATWEVVESHLEGCSSCSTEVELTLAALEESRRPDSSRTLPDSSSTPADRPPGVTEIGARARRPATSMVPSWTLAAAVLFIVGALALGFGVGLRTQLSAGLRPATYLVLGAVTRSDGSEGLSSAGEAMVLGLQLELPAGEGELSIEISSRNGRKVLERRQTLENARSLSDGGPLLIVLPQARFTEGHYRVVVGLQSGGDTRSLLQRDFSVVAP